MSLAEACLGEACRIESAIASDEGRKYEWVGIRPGKNVRVLCRYPGHEPRFLEVQAECGGIVTLPVAVAEKVIVRPL